MVTLELQAVGSILQPMGRRKRASLWGRTGRRKDRGRPLPGFYVRYSDYSAGRRIQRSKCFLTVKVAKQWARQFNAMHDLRAVGEVVPISFDGAIEGFSRGSGGLSLETARSYGISISLLRESIAQDQRVCDVGGADIDQFITSRSAVSTPSTVAKHLRNLGVFFRWCLKHGYVAENPIDQATSRPKARPRERPPISEAMLGRLIEAADTPDRKLAVAIAATTGLDRGQIERLTVGMIDPDTWSIVFVRTKTAKPNAVPIPAAIVPDVLARISGKPPSSLLLEGLSHQRRVKDWWKRAREKAGCPNVMFRDLRAVATSRLQRLGHASPREAQQLLGHRSLVTTLTHYHTPDPGVSDKLRSLPVPGFPPPAEPSTG